MLLAIDTSTAYGGVMMWENERPVYSVNWRSAYNQTKRLMPEIRRALQEAGIVPRELKGIAVALGPGGFSALRVGISAAKGLALPWGIPLVGVGTLEAEAFIYAETGSVVCPLLNIGRRDMAWARYQRDADGWRKIGEERITPNAELADLLPADAIICGEGVLTAGPLLRDGESQFKQLMEYPGPSLRLWGLARLAAARLERGETDDAQSLQPLYLRRPSITPPNPPRRVQR